MDVFRTVSPGASIDTVEMHTTGEPTRIVVGGYPSLEGSTLLEKRRYARENVDHLRKRLMREPRGHRDMYGAILVQQTELEEADIGVLFCHNEGYSTMCGHATIALGRFLVDTHDLTVFPKRERLVYDSASRSTALNLHAPCGLVRVTVPTVPATSAADHKARSDPSRPVSFLSVPSYAVAIDLSLQIPDEYKWPELSRKKSPSVTLDIAYGGAFYALVSADELGFEGGLAGGHALQSLDTATRQLKAYMMDTPAISGLLQHPTEPDLEYLYSVMIVDSQLESNAAGNSGGETGLCFFADQQVDRSPTGSCVSARVALAVAKGLRSLGEEWDYHSLVSLAAGGQGAFRGTAVERVKLIGEGKRQGVEIDAVVAKVEGQAWYTGRETFIVEEGDGISAEGFELHLPVGHA